MQSTTKLLTQLLTAVPIQTLFHVHHVVNTDVLNDYKQQLEQLGFLPGESILVQRKAPLSQDPLVVRVGASTYALRRAEAECVVVA